MAQPYRIQVLLVDDHTIVRAGVRFALSTTPDITVVGEAGDGKQALMLCAQLRPDVVLMDLKMPTMDGIEATRIMCQCYPTLRVVALTNFDDEEMVRRALQAGATSYLLKDVGLNELCVAIRAAFVGRSTLAPTLLDQLLRRLSAPPKEEFGLTDRELNVLALLALGYTNLAIAASLDITRNTVRSHVSSILGKLAASNRTEATMLALQHGLIQGFQVDTKSNLTVDFDFKLKGRLRENL